MDKRGQTLVEYVILLVVFTAVAVEGWELFRPTLRGLYLQIAQRRAGIKGMMP